jgi:hypothetical protein
MSCARKFHNTASNIKLISKLPSFRFKHLFAFTVSGLIPSLLSSFMVDMAHRVIIEDHKVTTFLIGLLQSSPVAARHTSVIHLENTEKGIDGRLHTWAKPEIRPWGSHLPPQCLKCFSFRPWKLKSPTGTSNDDAVFRCNGKTVEGIACACIITFPVPKDVDVKGNWISTPWPRPVAQT